MADVTLQVRLNGGALTSGGIESAVVGDECQLTALSKEGWNGAAVVWEIYSYPPDFACPAGWSEADDGTYYVYGSADPDPFELTHWGKYGLGVRAANQSRDERTAISIASPSGLRDFMRREGAQFGGQRMQWVKDQQRTLRALGVDMEELTLPLVLDRNKLITATADAIGKIAIIPATSGHVAGTTAIVNIAANELVAADDLIIGSDLDPEATWDTLDPTRGYTIGITVTDAAGAGKFVTSGKVQERTASAPTIVSAVVASGNPNALVVTWSAPVYLPDLTGLSLTFSAGTSRTITARESCNAAATEWTLTLSGNFDGTEVCNLVVGASRTARAANGTLVTAETEAINVSFAANWTMPSQENFWRGDDMATSGSNVTAVTDQTGSDDMATPGSDLAVVSNIGSTSRTGFKPTGAGSYLEADFASRDMSTGFCLFAVLRVPSHAALTCVYLSSGRNGAATTSDCLLYETGGNLINWRTNGSDDCSSAFSATVLVDIMLQVDPGGTAARLYIDGALVDTELADVSTSNISRWTIGALPDHSLPATNIEYGEVRIGRGTTYDGDDATAGHAYRLAYYV